METSNRESAYPVQLEVPLPERYDRIQLVLRVLVCISIGLVHQSLGGLAAALYLLLPVLAAILISHRTGPGYIARDAAWIGNALEWIVGLYAYMLFVTDRFPLESDTRCARVRIACGGTPTLFDALARLVAGLPHALLLALLSIIAGILSLVMGALILIRGSAPATFQHFQRDYVARLARFFAYHASLIDVYPPFVSAGEQPGPSDYHAPLNDHTA